MPSHRQGLHDLLVWCAWAALFLLLCKVVLDKQAVLIWCSDLGRGAIFIETPQSLQSSSTLIANLLEQATVLRSQADLQPEGLMQPADGQFTDCGRSFAQNDRHGRCHNGQAS